MDILCPVNFDEIKCAAWPRGASDAQGERHPQKSTQLESRVLNEVFSFQRRAAVPLLISVD